ncbi:hypothetical protein [Tautonia marina]|uniref:hypothetical protein n=1 Tax=Tautonia marina TaxID=2653855 RepID=UPI0012607D8A|nr:hypothetical protein [Tautonia marina]
MAHLTTISGTYRDGVIELSERPAGVSAGARVLVTFLDEASIAPEEREALRQEAFADMRRGIDLGGAPYPTREELNERNR